MSLFSCIENAVANNWVTPDEGEALKKRLRELIRVIPRTEDAQAQIVAEMEAEAKRRHFHARLTAEKDETLTRDLMSYRNRWGQQDIAEALQYLFAHNGQAKFGDIESARKAILAGVHGDIEAALYEFRKGAVAGDFRRKRGEVKANLENMVREIFGEGTGDAKAAHMAKVFTDAMEQLRVRANDTGFAIGKLEGGYVPQHHNALALLNKGFTQWRDDILPLLDRSRMKNPLTGGVMTDADLERALAKTYDRITTDGWIDRDPSFVRAGKGILANQHDDHRFLHFKDAKSWLEYQRNYGKVDPFAAIMGHINTMARDIAIAERLGPNPRAMFEKLSQMAEKAGATAPRLEQIRAEQLRRLDELTEGVSTASDARKMRMAEIVRELDALRAKGVGRPGREATEGRKRLDALYKELGDLQEQHLAAERNFLAGDEPLVGITAKRQEELRQLLVDMKDAAAIPQMRDPLGYARGRIDLARRMFEQIDGSANSPVNSTTANTFAAIRSFITSTTLGSAMLTAITDAGFGVMARQYNGLPVADMIGSIGKAFTPERRREAVRAGLILDSALHVMHSQARYAGSLSSSTMSGFLADRVIAAQGLSAWTQAGKHAFGLEFQGFVADNAHLAWAKIDPALRRTLDRHGFDARAWDLIRKAEHYKLEEGAGILRPNEIKQVAGRALAERYIAMILRETTYAVPEKTVRAAAAMEGHVKKGSLVGEFVRNAAQFKSFGVTIAMLMASRVGRDLAAGEFARGAVYAGGLLVSTTLLGALSLQLKEVAGGRDLRTANPADQKGKKFWGAAMLQGGGLGIYGDFLFADVNRMGGSLGSTLAGPLLDRATTLRNLTVGNAAEAFDSEKKTTNAGRELVSFLKQNTPGGSLWYARLVYERVVLDQLQYLVDKDARGAFHRRAQTRKREIGNSFWWAPGEIRPGG